MLPFQTDNSKATNIKNIDCSSVLGVHKQSVTEQTKILEQKRRKKLHTSAYAKW